MPTPMLHPRSSPATMSADQQRLNQAVVTAFEALPPRKQTFSDAELIPLREALQAGGSPDQLDRSGHNLLGIAVYRACQQKRRRTVDWPVPPLVALLLEFNANPNAVIHSGTTAMALYDAAQSASLQLVDALLAAGAHPDGRADKPLPWSPHRQDFFRTALHNPYNAGQAERLIAAGADVNARDVGGERPLHTAIAVNKLDVVKVLIAHGADPNARDIAGDVPLHKVNRPEQIDVLMRAGADPNQRGRAGKTPLETLRSSLAGHTEKLSRTPNALKAQVIEDVQRLSTLVVNLDRAELLRNVPDPVPSPPSALPRPRL